MPINPQELNAWCCEPTYYGSLCEYPAEYEVIYGNAPDDVTLLCEGHLEEIWQPTWQAIPLDEELRQSYAVTWEEWTGRE